MWLKLVASSFRLPLPRGEGRGEGLRTAIVGLIALGLCATACKEEQAPPFEVVIKFSSAKDKPLKNALVLHEGKKIGVSGDDGAALLRLRGNEGETFLFSVQCPAEFESPKSPVTVVLRRVLEASRRSEYFVSCPPLTRTVVVAVRADNGPNLPVIHLGREVARTDESGAAHVMMQLRPNESFELRLDTNDKAAERLRPQNPVATFVVKQQDDIFAFDQKFTLEKKKVRYYGGPVGPTKLTQ